MKRLAQLLLMSVYGFSTWAGGASLARARDEIVQLVFAASEPDAEEVRSALASALELEGISCSIAKIAHIDAHAPVTPKPEPVQPLARIWVDFTGARVLIYVADRGWERLYVRSFARAVAQTAVDAAQAAEIVRAAVEALRDGAVIGVARPTLPPAVVNEERKVSERAVSASMGAFYGVGMAASQRVAHGPGLFARVVGRASPWGAVALVQVVPRVVTSTAVTTRLDTLALRLGPALQFPWSSHGALLLHGAFGANLVRVAPEPQAGLVTADVRILRLAVGQLGLGVRYRTLNHAELWLSALLDVDFSNTRYVVRRGADLQTIETPWTFRPSLALGAGVF